VTKTSQTQPIIAHEPGSAELVRFQEVHTGQAATPQASPGMTVGRYFELWLLVFVKPNRSFATHRQYEQVWRNYLKPILEECILAELTAFECQAALNSLLDRVSPRTVELVRTILVKALSDAMRQGLLSINPAKATFRPKVRPPRLRALRPEECKRLLDHLEDDMHDQVLKFLLGTGLRISEALGTTWDCIDPERKLLKVESRLQWLPEGKWHLTHLKSRKSQRTVPLGTAAKEVLETLDSSRSKRKGLIFISSANTPLWPRNVQRALDLALKRAKMEHISLHDLRRSFASTLAAGGTPVHILQALLGHENVNTTLSHYAASFEEDLHRAVWNLSYD